MKKKQVEMFEKLKVGVQLIREDKPDELPKIKCPEDIVELTSSLKNKDREHFLCMHLDTRNAVLGIETVSIGALNSSVVHPREIFKAAILNSAAQVVLVHNHPSGNCQPSEDDIEVTKRIVEAGKLIGIEVTDHVIVGVDSYFSFKQENLLGVKS